MKLGSKLIGGHSVCALAREVGGRGTCVLARRVGGRGTCVLARLVGGSGTCVLARLVGGRVRICRRRVRGCCRDDWRGSSPGPAPFHPGTHSVGTK